VLWLEYANPLFLKSLFLRSLVGPEAPCSTRLFVSSEPRTNLLFQMHMPIPSNVRCVWPAPLKAPLVAPSVMAGKAFLSSPVLQSYAPRISWGKHGRGCLHGFLGLRKQLSSSWMVGEQWSAELLLLINLSLYFFFSMPLVAVFPGFHFRKAW